VKLLIWNYHSFLGLGSSYTKQPTFDLRIPVAVFETPALLCSDLAALRLCYPRTFPRSFALVGILEPAWDPESMRREVTCKTCRIRMKEVKGHIYHKKRKWRCPKCERIRMQDPKWHRTASLSHIIVAADLLAGANFCRLPSHRYLSIRADRASEGVSPELSVKRTIDPGLAADPFRDGT